MKKYILLSLLIYIFSGEQFLWGQITEKKDSIPSKISNKDIKKISKKLAKDSSQSKEPLKFTGIRLGFDIARPIAAVLEDNAFALELNTEYLFNRVYYFTADIAWQQIERQDQAKSFVYQNQGIYARIGIQKNYAKEAKLNQVFFLGLHYGFASFEQNIRYQITSQNWGTFENANIENKGLQAHWLEVSSGLKVPVLPRFYFSPLLRATIRIYNNAPEDLAVNEIPGIGLRKTIIRFRVGYQILYQF